MNAMLRFSRAGAVLAAALAVAGALAARPARAVEFGTVLTDQSRLLFSYKQMGVEMPGRFNKFSARLAFDPARPQAAQASLDIEVAGIDAGSAEANDEVLGKQWFDARTFPRASFVASAIRPTGPGRYEVAGKLSIKGRSAEVVAPASFKQEGGLGIFEGAFTLRRADFAIGEGPWADFGTVANEVQIRFHLVAAAAAGKK